MKTTLSILRDLLPGQSTPDSTAGRLRQPTKVIEAFLSDLASDGLVETRQVNDTLTAYRLTERGTQVAISRQ